MIKHLPIHEKAFHAGSGNGRSIGIEVCMHQGIDQEAANLRAARLVAALMHDLDISLDNVVPHKHWTGKACPVLLLPRWEQFKRQVAEIRASIRGANRMLLSERELEATRSLAATPASRSRGAEPDLDHELVAQEIEETREGGISLPVTQQPAPGSETFLRLGRSEFAKFATVFARHARRSISEIHLHHSGSPDAEDFHRLSNLLGSDEAAGQEIMRRIWRYHTQDRGFQDIAQHVTIMPDGGIWLGRPWDRPPVSARGFNGSPTRGPLMVTLIGDFSIEAPSPEALSAVAAVVAALRLAFSLPEQAVLFHNDLNRNRACPGNQLDRQELIGVVDEAMRELETTRGGTSGPLPDLQETTHLSVEWMQKRNALLSEPGADEIANELEESPGRIVIKTERSASGGARAALSPQLLRQLRPHVINLRQGAFSNEGIFTNTAEDLEILVNQNLKNWIRAQRAAGKEPHVLIYAHGGLVSEESALLMVAHYYRWWLENGVYPIYFVWETGTLETTMQLIGNLFRRERFLGEARDFMVESLVRRLGRPFWSTMKVSAERTSDDGTGPDGRPRFGGHYLARLLGELKEDDRPIVHAVGHSAGSILHAYLVRELKKFGVPVKTLQFLAPACTVSLFRREVMPLINGSDIGHFSLFAMTREAERADPTVPGYGKSLLYLVSRGFEREMGTPILGLQESVLADTEVRALLGLGSRPGGKANAVWSPTGDSVPPILRSNSVTHGGFDNDGATLVAVLTRVLGRNETRDLHPVPEVPEGRAFEPLFRPLENILSEDELMLIDRISEPATASPPLPVPPTVEEPASPSSPAWTTPPPARFDGKRRALCIGIDSYPQQPLAGCVADANLWKRTLEELGFSASVMPEREATWEGLRERIGNLVADARAGDVVVLHYSGHGTFLPDETGDEEDFYDEALVPIDFENGRFLLDDDLRGIFSRLHPETHFIAFFDCCHSGTISRLAVGRPMLAPGVRERFLKLSPELKQAHSAFRAQMGRSSRFMARAGQEEMRHIQFSACQDNQTAKESGGHGWFSLTATTLIRSGARGLSNAAFLQALAAEFGRRDYRDQDPRLEGPIQLKDSPFLLVPSSVY